MANTFHRLRRLAALVCACVVVAACSSRATVGPVTVTHHPPASVKKVVVAVDKTKNNEKGEAIALENGLVREFRRAGYEVTDGGLTLQAEIAEIHRGSTFANVAGGMGAGSDHADVVVRVTDGDGSELLSFAVRGKVLDKRYRELHEALNEDVPQSIREEIEKASR